MTDSSPTAVLMQADVCQMPESDTSYSNSRFFLGCDILNDWASERPTAQVTFWDLAAEA